MLPHDLAVLQAMAADLSDYLLSEVLFWQLGGSHSFPKLSLGAMLLTRARLRATATQLDANQRATQAQAEKQIDAVLTKWPVAAERKAQKELGSRVNLWQGFLDDCREQPDTCADNYAGEVSQRVMAALLLREFPRLADTAEARRLPPLDAQVRPRLKGGTFIWPTQQQTAFPRTEFWFLYGQIE